MTKRIFRTWFALCVSFLVGACVSRPSHSPIIGERFIDEPVTAGRIAIITKMPGEYREKLAKPLAEQLIRIFEENGIQATSEIHILNPLALNSDIDISRASLTKPNGYLVIKLGGTVNASSRLVFDFFDQKQTGIWRGMTSLGYMRSDNQMTTITNSIAKSLLQKVIDDRVLIIQKTENIK